MKKALITGIAGQDGAYLADFSLNKGYKVHGIKRRSSLFNTAKIDHLYQDLHEAQVRFKLHYGDLSDSTNLTRIIREVQPDEIYNLGAMSHIKMRLEEGGTMKSCSNADYQREIDKKAIAIDPKYFKNTEVDFMIKSPTKSEGAIKLGT